MPELPEVETVVRSIAAHITGQTIRSAAVSSARVTRNDHRSTEQGLAAARIVRVRRHGKQIHIELDRGLLYIHLGMTGNLLWNAAPGKYTRAVLELDNGVLLLNDIRQFGRFEYYAETPEQRVGPDALALDFETFFARLHGRKSAIKPLLLNQSFIGGVGNIYADEALFAARIHPRTVAARLSETRARRLFDAILQVLEAAIARRGSTISNHVDASGEKGSYQSLHAVYGREGEPCLRCGTPIRRIVLGQRSTHYCPRCQRV
ncbi:MAG TPA: bifunctional DNA-formamidopyrimidine glycosylase/DNA-(apurinic or apyrimidinic site) lyase [Bryobacteraceae bacterium]|nr:bifunctional DNA-formamidopyrimidine glycosylase/DNA-(apurinic or apyrimidinic site) lyase [Bryobacteraceae bacterium]